MVSSDRRAAINAAADAPLGLRIAATTPLAQDFASSIAAEGFIGLPIRVSEGEAAGRLPGPHRDPFDRLLIAQALAESLTLISNERLFDRYGVARLW
jgi:PIN domain nuclease of toxin-antitoxin system